jgi:hypothetical protein
MAIPVSYSREMARITGRTMPAWVGSVHKTRTKSTGGVYRREPSFGLSGGAFDQFISNRLPLLESIGRRVEHFVRGHGSLPRLEQAWCDGAYWFHEGLAEPLDTIAVAKLETALEVLLGAESTKLSNARLRHAMRAFYGLNENDPLTHSSTTTVKQYVEGIVGSRSRILHGTFSTLTESVDATRADVEAFSFDLLRLSSLSLDQYSVSATPSDESEAFLSWIEAERQSRRWP